MTFYKEKTMNINWEPIIAAVFAVINAVAVYVLVPYIKSKP